MKAGFIAVVGRPNVGKSTLINKLVNEKVAIVSDKAGTTRDTIKGILNFNGNQYIFVDTPGIHKPKHLLGEHMTNSALRVLRDVDVIAMVIDASQEISTGDLFVWEKVKEAKKTPRILIVNKIDKITDEELVKKREEIAEKLGDFDAIVEIAGQYAIGVPKLLEALDPFLEDGIKYYPDDMITDVQERFVVSEIVREKALRCLRDEVPHGIAVDVIQMKQSENGTYHIEVDLICEKDSHKGIIIGKNGQSLKRIGETARYELERFLHTKVNIKIWVKVRKEWRDNQNLLKELGYKKVK